MKVLSDLKLVVLTGVILVGGLLAEADAREGGRAFDLGQVIVTATRTEHRLGDVPVAASVITREEIEAKNIKTVQDALIFLTGVRVRRWPGTWGFEGNVQMQGLPAKHTLVLIDGQRLIRARGMVDVHQISIAMIERIEVVRGPASVLFGSDALGGVINIITRPVPDVTTTSVSTAFGSRATQIHEVSSSFRGGRWGASFNLTRRESDGVRGEFIALDRRGREVKHSDASEIQIFQGALEFEFNPTSKLTLRPLYSVLITQDRGAVGAIETSYRREQRQQLNAIWEWSPDELSVLNIRGSWHGCEKTTEEGALVRSGRDEYIHEFEVNYSRMLGRHTLTGGYHYQHHKRDDWVMPFRADQVIHSFFLQNEIDLEPLTLVLGARLDEHDRWGTEISPRVSLLYRVTEALRLRASVGTGLKGPTLFQLHGYWTHPRRWCFRANPYLKPETSIGYQLGVEYEFSPRTLGKLSFFRNEVEDMISGRGEMVGPPPWPRFWENIEEVTTQGVELNLASQLTDNLSGRFGYTLLSTEDELTGLELTLRPRNMLTLELNQRIPVLNLNLNLAGIHTGRRYRDRANTIRVPGHTVFDLALTKDIRAHQLFVRLDNILGKEDVIDERGLDGTEFLAGLRMNF